ncbi:MAG: response regulator [Deltaproteobacteria bacterium]|nr:response regulator [Deltaproteobacteria bacterium]
MNPHKDPSMDPTMVIADDDAELRAAVARILRRRFPDVLVVEAEDGEMALDLVDDQVVCVVADVNMPYRDGFSVCWTLRHSDAFAPWHDVPVILMSGAFHDRPALERAWMAGSAFVVPKPFNEERLVRAVASTTGLVPVRRETPPELPAPLALPAMPRPNVEALWLPDDLFPELVFDRLRKA